MFEKIDHVGIAVKNLDEALKLYRDVFGLEVKLVEVSKEFKARIAFIPIGDVLIELVEPTEPAGNLAKFIEETGGGMRHIAFRVKNIDDAVAELKKKGMKFRIEEPRRGGAGSRIVLLEPNTTHNVLVELVEREGLGI